MNKLLMIQPGAFGDIIACAPIAHFYHDAGWEVWWPAREKFIPTLKHFDYVNTITLNEDLLHEDWLRSDVMKILSMSENYDAILNLADRGPHPTAQRFDENFETCKYRIAQVPFECKHLLEWTRNLDKEKELFDSLNISGSYAVAHLENSHGDEAPMPYVGLPLIKIKPIEGYTILDWYLVLSEAEEIYCVESAVHQFVDGFIHCAPSSYLLKKGPVEEGTRHTVSKYWDLGYIGENSIVKG
jgi:hypothetical protein